MTISVSRTGGLDHLITLCVIPDQASNLERKEKTSHLLNMCKFCKVSDLEMTVVGQVIHPLVCVPCSVKTIISCLGRLGCEDISPFRDKGMTNSVIIIIIITFSFE